MKVFVTQIPKNSRECPFTIKLIKETEDMKFVWIHGCRLDNEKQCKLEQGKECKRLIALSVQEVNLYE